MFAVFAIILALGFAANVGASGTAPSMSAAYGSGVLRRRVVALGLVAVAMVAGAVLLGDNVAKTLAGGLTHDAPLTSALVTVILLSAIIPLMTANLLGLPLSTSEVTVGAVVGAGLAYARVDWSALGVVLAAWAALPLVAFTMSAAIMRLTGHWLQERLHRPGSGRLRAVLGFLLVAAGVYEGFSAGANNVGNAAGPLHGGGLVSLQAGVIIGGLAMAAGALALGGRVLETGGKRLAEITLASGTIIAATTGTLVLVASLFGIPVPLVQTAGAATMGAAFAWRGREALGTQVIRDMATIWLVSPIVSLVVAFLLAHLAIGVSPVARPVTYGVLSVGLAMAVFTFGVVNRARLHQGLRRAKRGAAARTIVTLIRPATLR